MMTYLDPEKVFGRASCLDYVWVLIMAAGSSQRQSLLQRGSVAVHVVVDF